jgi:hypothetical protein
VTRLPTWQLFLGAAVLVVAGVLFGRYAVPSSSARSSPSTSLSSLPRVYSFGCAGEAPPTVDPTSLPVACADGSAVLTHVVWSAWSASVATGRGTLELNDCTPDCAAGKFSPYAATVTLSDPVPSRTQGEVFALMVVRADDGKGGAARTTRVPVYSRSCDLTDC